MSLHGGAGFLDGLSEDLHDLGLGDGLSVWAWYQRHAGGKVDL